MPPRHWKLRIEDILGCIAKIQRYTEDLTFETFSSDDKTVDAVLRNFEIIGEAARYVPPEITQRYDSVPWNKLRGMCNVLMHEYFGVGLPIVWQTTVDDLPPLVPLLQAILEREV